MSVKVDEFRKPYAADPIKQARAFVLAMTSNRSDFINDAESRRTLPLRIPNDHEVPVEWFEKNKRALWARALKEYEKGTRYLFTRKEIQENKRYLDGFRTEDPIEPLIDTYLADKTEVASWEIVEVCLKIPRHLQDRKDIRRITDKLKTRGWENKPTSRKEPGAAQATSVRLWFRPKWDPVGSQPITDF